MTSLVFESYRYDPQGRLAAQVNALGTVTPAYAGGSPRATSVTTARPDGAALLQSSFAHANGQGDRRLTQIQHSTVGALLSQFDYAYAPAGGNLTAWTKTLAGAAPRVWSLGYDLDDQITTVEARDAAGELLPGQSEFNTYDLAGNRASRQSGQTVTQDTHNALNQLRTRIGGGPVRVAGRVNEPASVTVGGLPAKVNADGTFESRLTVPPGITDVAITAKDPSGNETQQVWRFSTQGGAGFSAPCEYDAGGNLVARYAPQADGTIKVYRYEWDPLNRLKAVTVGPETAPNQPAPGAKRTEWTYDGQSRRMRQVDSEGMDNGFGVLEWNPLREVTFLWDGTELTQQRDATGATVQVDYFANGEVRQPSSSISNPQSSISLYYTRDHLGSIREVVDATGAVRARYDYDAWGQRTKLEGDVDCERGFTGHYYHEGSGLHLALYRVYDAELGRWLSEDPIGESGGINLYAYAKNRVVIAIDPLGLDLFLLNKPSALGGIGHNALLTGCPANGYDFRSFSTGESKVTPKDNLQIPPHFDTWEKAVNFLKSEGYSRYIEWPSTAAQDKAAIDFIDKWYTGKWYNPVRRHANCTRMAQDGLNAAGIDLRHAELQGHPNKFFQQAWDSPPIEPDQQKFNVPLK